MTTENTQDTQKHNLELLAEMQNWTGDFSPYRDVVNEIFYKYIGDNIDKCDVCLTGTEVFYLKSIVDFFNALKITNDQ
ncbi:hypothetical protein [Flavobacterium johnsoniae]|uniref:Uncharacterized protein n=1 Tax=Flavobacterium johnsoniae TaxID=986 RepID=A0A1M5WBI7_FLAJO|nr:hypothetical protein [Flavobacterium johnsoniae]SHH84817.1 hypothetical protein SAMN05444388_1293 [Flavobacterium johnsoniae]